MIFEGRVVLSLPQKDGEVYLRKRTVVFCVPHKKGTVGSYFMRNLIVYALHQIRVGLMGWVKCVVPLIMSALLNL